MSAGGSWIAETSPLLNSLILTEIFNNLDPLELGALRLVCRAWRDAAREPWNRSLVIIVEQEKNTSKPEVGGSSSPSSSSSSYPLRLPEQYPLGTLYIHRSLEELMSLEFDLPRRGYRNFVIEDWNLSTGNKRGWTEGEKDFWRLCGPFMHRLHLLSCTFDDVSSFMELLLGGKLPELKMLEMGNQSFLRYYTSSSSRWMASPPPSESSLDPERIIHGNLTWLQVPDHSLPFSWIKFLSHFPNLKKIEFSLGDNEWFDSDFSFFRVNYLLKALEFGKGEEEEEEKRQKIEHLDISQLKVMVEDEAVPKATFALLKDLQLPLTTLKLSIGGAFEDELTILNLVRSYSSTLQTLVFVKLCSRSASTLMGYPFSQPMSRLQSLELIGNVTSSFTFLQFTPNLKKLTFSPYCLSEYVLSSSSGSYSRGFPKIDGKFRRAVDRSWKKDPAMAEVKLEQLLELQLGYGFTKPEHAKRLGGWMPNVKRLSVTATPGFFRGLCGTWGHSLEELKLLSPSLFSDKEILGEIIPPPGKGPSSSSGRDRIPNITDLKNLRVFETEHPHKHQEFVDFMCSHRVDRLTSRSITAGFLRLEKLEMLKIYPSEWIGESAEASLRRRNRKLKLIMEVVRTCKCQSNVVVRRGPPPGSSENPNAEPPVVGGGGDEANLRDNNDDNDDDDLEYNMLPLRYSSEPDSSDSEPEEDEPHNNADADSDNDDQPDDDEGRP